MTRLTENIDTFTIGEVAKRSGIGIETIRFYEKEGLIPSPPRTSSGYRQYQPEVVDRLAFISRAKELGFSLSEISELLSLKLSSKTKCADVRCRAEDKIAEIENKIKTLRRMKQALTKLTEACNGNGSVSDCPILDALESKARK